jgi:hypothetical protein
MFSPPTEKGSAFSCEAEISFWAGSASLHIMSFYLSLNTGNEEVALEKTELRFPLFSKIL